MIPRMSNRRDVAIPEFTLKAVFTGVVLGIVFGAANAYLGLRAGLTISTSIPVAVMTVAAFRALARTGNRSSILEAFTDDDRREAMTRGTNIFRVLIKTLLKAGIITERTRPTYAAWVDIDELRGESDEVVGSDVAEAAMDELREINRGRKRIGRVRPPTQR